LTAPRIRDPHVAQQRVRISLTDDLPERVRISLTNDLLDGCVGDEAEIIFVGPDIDMLIHVSVSRV
jgi:hypothetical protein